MKWKVKKNNKKKQKKQKTRIKSNLKMKKKVTTLKQMIIKLKYLINNDKKEVRTLK